MPYDWDRFTVRVGALFLAGFLIGLMLGACGSEPQAPLIDSEIAAHCSDMGKTYDAVLQACV